MRAPALLTLLALAACTRSDEEGVDTADTSVSTDTSDTSDSDDTATAEASFALGSDSTVAGNSVEVIVRLTHSDGSVETPSFTLTSDLESAVDLQGTSLTPTVAGTHTLTATLDNSGDALTATLDVAAAAAATVELTATPSEGIDPDGFTIFDVAQHDAFGNPTSEVITLTTSPEGPVVANDSVTFPAEGQFELTATVESGASHTIGPLTIDATGPELLLSTPDRGAVLPEGPSTVTGTVLDDWSDIDVASLGGTELTVESSGGFSHSVDLDFGMTLLEGSATDVDGNTSTSVNALVAGGTAALGTSTDDGLILRIFEGDGGLDTVAEGATAYIDAAYLYSQLPDPVYETSGRHCTVFLGQQVCRNYAVEVNAISLSFADLTTTLDPSTDLLTLTMTATDVEMPWTADGNYGPQNASDNGTATATSLTVQANLSLAVVNGSIEATLIDVSTDVVDLDMGFTGDTATMIAFTGIDPEPEIEAAVEAAATTALEAQLGDAITDALDGLGVSETIPLSTTSATLNGEPSRVSIDDDGLTVGIDTVVLLDQPWPSGLPNPGALTFPFTGPVYGGGAGTAAALSGDTLNQLLYASFGAGVLNTTRTNEALGLDMSTVSLLLPALSDLTMVVSPTYAPLVRPHPTSDGLQLQLPELKLELYDGLVDPTTLTYTLYASMEADVALEVDGSRLSLATSNEVFTADVVQAPDGADTETIETALELLMVLVVDDITGTVADIPLPSLQGATLTQPTSQTVGPEGGYVEVSGLLEL